LEGKKNDFWHFLNGNMGLFNLYKLAKNLNAKHFQVLSFVPFNAPLFEDGGVTVRPISPKLSRVSWNLHFYPHRLQSH
jgi:hypothetical protein